MEKVRPWCGQPSDRVWLKNRTVTVQYFGTWPGPCCSMYVMCRCLCLVVRWYSVKHKAEASEVKWNERPNNSLDV